MTDPITPATDAADAMRADPATDEQIAAVREVLGSEEIRIPGVGMQRILTRLSIAEARMKIVEARIRKLEAELKEAVVFVKRLVGCSNDEIPDVMESFHVVVAETRTFLSRIDAETGTEVKEL